MSKFQIYMPLLVIACGVLTANAQVIPKSSQIVAGEYFLGNDPGIGKGTPIPVSNPSTTVTSALFNLHLANNQAIHFRFKNANGLWSAPRSLIFSGTGVNRSAFIKYVEYFLSSDPGRGNGTSVSITSARNTPIKLSTLNLNQGQYVHLRVQDDQGRWSSPVSLLFPTRTIAGAEVVVASNPATVAPGHGIAMTPISGSFGTGIVNVQANVSNWNKTDTIWVRAWSSQYLWSKPIGSVAVMNPPPVVTSVSPTTVARLQTLNVQINGSNFLPGKTTVSFGSDIIINSVTVSSGSQLVVNVTVPSTASLGNHNAYVTNPSPGGGIDTLLNALNVVNPSPIVNAVQPSTVHRLEVVSDTLMGSGFISGVTTVSLGQDISMSSLTVVSSSKLVLNFSVSGNAVLGARDLVVMNALPGGGSDTLRGGLVVNNPLPTLTGISPSSAFRGDQVTVTLNGNNYLPGVSSVNVSQGIVIDTFYVRSQTQIVLKIRIPDSLKPGNKLIWVNNAPPGGGSSSTVNFMVADHPPLPARLVMPANRDTIQLHDPPVPIVFSWLKSVDPDVGDSVSYSLHLVGPGLDTTFLNLKDTLLTTNLMPVLRVSSTYGWSVSVTDGYTIVASPDSFLIRTSDNVTPVHDSRQLPGSFALYQNYPNPFNPTTVITYDLPKPTQVKIIIYDYLGRQVEVLVDDLKPAGSYKVKFDGSGLPSGVYFYRLTAGSFVDTKKFILMK